MKRLACRLFGHPRFVQRVMPESPTLRYGHGPRDYLGRALSWPTCVRCGRMIVSRIVE